MTKKALHTWCLIMLLVAPVAVAKPVKRHLGAGIEGKYIVLFPNKTAGSAVDGLARSLAGTYNLEVTTTWQYVKGFVALGSLEAATALADDPRVELVEQDVLMRAPLSGAGSTISPTSLNGNSLWYLDRLDEDYWDNSPGNAPDNSYHRCPDGAAAVAYIMDMPVWAEHTSISDRVSATRIDCSSGMCQQSDAGAMCKQNSSALFAGLAHGTAVASLLSGQVTGSSRAEIIPVTIFPCQANPTTSLAIVLAAINWIEGNVLARRNAGDNRPSLVNHSGYLFPWDADAPAYTAKARDFVINTNVPYFTSADNFGSDSCLFSPNENAYTRASRHWTRAIFVVGATARNYGGTDATWWNPNWTNNANVPSKDAQYRGTNLGGCVSAFAPGDQVYAAAHSPDPEANNPTYDVNLYVMNQNKSSGTSWASPLAAGIALRKLEELGPPQPYYASLYDWLIGWSASPAKATVDATILSAYKICYTPGSPSSWNYYPPAMNCGPTEAEYQMPSVGNTSDAGMLTWARACP